MKDYPSIPGSRGNAFREIKNCYVFNKIDGSSMRSEWSKKSGWYKHGKRKGLIDDSNPHLVTVPALFMETLADQLTRIAKDNHWKHLVVFYEFWGAQSFAGLHEEDDPKFLTVFDIAADKKGILGPKEFRRRIEGNVETPKCIEICNWTRGYVDRVRKGQVECAFEGVVGKAGSGHKAKTQAWVDKVLEIHGAEAGQKIVNS